MNFDKYSFDQLLGLIDEDFYQRVTDEDCLKSFMQEFYIQTLGKLQLSVRSELAELKYCQMGNSYGQHIPGDQFDIYLNEKFLILFDICKHQNNLFLPYIMATTIAHETRHKQQEMQIEKMHGIVKNVRQLRFKFPELNNVLGYISNPEEIDARYSAYQLVKDSPAGRKFTSHSDFLQREIACTYKGFSSVEEFLLSAQTLTYFFTNQGLPFLSYSAFGEKNLNLYCDLESFVSEFHNLLKSNKIDPDMYGQALKDEQIAADEYQSSKPSEREKLLVSQINYSARVEMAEKLLQGQTVGQKDFKEISNKLEEENLSPLAKNYIIAGLPADLYRLQETQMVYRLLAPEFSTFSAKLPFAPSQPAEEVEFVEMFKG